MIAYLDFSVSTTGMLAGIKMSHGAATSLCLGMKVSTGYVSLYICSVATVFLLVCLTLFFFFNITCLIHECTRIINFDCP